MTKFLNGIVLLVIPLVLFGCVTTVRNQSTVLLKDVLTFSQIHQGDFQDLRLVNQPNQQLKVGNVVDTNANTIKTLSFDGATKITLMPNTRVKIISTGIELLTNQSEQSQLFLEHHPSQPKQLFLAKTQHITIMPAGTLYSIKAFQQDVSVDVFEGGTELFSNSRSWQPKLVNKHENATVRGGNAPVTQPVTVSKMNKLIHPVTQVEFIIAKPHTPQPMTVAEIMNKYNLVHPVTQVEKIISPTPKPKPFNTSSTNPTTMSPGKFFQDPLKDGGLGPEMVVIPAGRIQMTDIGGYEEPMRWVNIKYQFAMGKFEVTVGEFKQFVNATHYKTDAEKKDGCWVDTATWEKKEDANWHSWTDDGDWEKKEDANWRNPYFLQNGKHPIVCVTKNDINAYIKWLNQQTGQEYRLPSDAEWEYAARARTTSKYWWGNDIGKNKANCDGCGSYWDKKSTAPVGSFQANQFGLYDVVGNIVEIVADIQHTDYGTVSVISRDCPWRNEPSNCYIADRMYSKGSSSSVYGFRIARSINVPKKVKQVVVPQLAKSQPKPFNTIIPKAGLVFQDTLKDGSLGPKMVVIPAGRFRMGDIQGASIHDYWSHWRELPVHWVNINYQFAIGRYEVTFTEYDKFAEAIGREKPDDEGWGRDNRPVINVSWYDAVAYTEWLSKQTRQKYRLPSEAEWEYAARAGTETKYWWGNEIGVNKTNCNNRFKCGNNFETTAPIGSFSANAFGLYDIVGNVSEWVADAWHGDYTGAPTDGSVWSGAANNVGKMKRGGSWSSRPHLARIADRTAAMGGGMKLQTDGFRIARSID